MDGGRIPIRDSDSGSDAHPTAKPASSNTSAIAGFTRPGSCNNIITFHSGSHSFHFRQAIRHLADRCRIACPRLT